MSRPILNPAAVDWSGENPCIYLKDTLEGPYSALVTFFRVVWSPHGTGHACFLLEAPERDRPNLNVCINDNEPLARWLASEFVQYFGAFRPVKGLSTVSYVTGDRFSGTLEGGRKRYTEQCNGAGLDVRMSWEGLSEAVMVDIPAERSATTRHEMYSVVVDAQSATILVNGRRLAGNPVPREFFGRASTTAFLAFSETWVKAR